MTGPGASAAAVTRGRRPPSPSAAVPALEARGVAKRYGASAIALDGCDFRLEPGEVHVLLGTNGCGKSTLCKVVAGAVDADAGQVLLDGAPVRFRSPLEARDAGIATVYQELSLNPTQSVAANVMLGHEPRRGPLVDRRALAARARAALDGLGKLGAGIDPRARVGDLSIDARQVVEIAKALVRGPRVILFDESTSSLDASQVAAFFELVRRLRDEGRSIIFISHRMEEIFEIGDRVTVMVGGRAVETLALADATRETLVASMVGAAGPAAVPVAPTPDAASPAPPPPVAASKDAVDRAATPVATPSDPCPRLSIESLHDARLAPLDLEVAPGEIVGLGGLHGQGQSHLLQLLFGSFAPRGGAVRVAGAAVPPGNVPAALRAGLSYVSGDRGRDGSLTGRPILENLALSLLCKSGARRVRPGALETALLPVVERLSLKYSGFGAAIDELSGGNQQKTIIGRALASRPAVLLLDDPTKGIDVRAKADLFALIRELCAGGLAVLLYSSEDAELLEHADRVLVFNSGAVVDRLEGARLNETELYSAALEKLA